MTHPRSVPLVIGHRGVRGLEPENTLRAFRRALEWPVDGVELDVRLTRDGCPVVIHDKTVERTTDGVGAVAELTLAEVRQLDAGSGERIPTLGEALDCLAGRGSILVEIKVAEALAPSLREIEAMNRRDGVHVISFLTETLAQCRRVAPEIPLTHLFGEPPEDAIKRTRAAGAGTISINHAKVKAEHVAAAREAGLRVALWTVNAEEDLRRALDLRADCITSDRPDLLLRWLGRI